MLTLSLSKFKSSEFYDNKSFDEYLKEKPKRIDKHKSYCYWSNDKGQYHRDNNPAAVYIDGSRFWYNEGYLHREDGPAMIDVLSGKELVRIEWFWMGKNLVLSSQKEFEQLIKLKMFW